MEAYISCRNISFHRIGYPYGFISPSQKAQGRHFRGLISKIPRHSIQNRGRVFCAGKIESRDSKRRMFIFGMGFVGQYLAEQLKSNGWRVSGTCTSEEKKKKLEEKGYEAFIFKAEDMMEGHTLAGLEALYDATHIISSIPPSVDGKEDPVVFQLGEVLQQAISKGNTCWIGYLSSTRVYGHWGGDWVDEDSPAKSLDETSLARLNAEKAWIILGKSAGVSTQVFRLGGIYGPGRSALDTIIKQQKLSSSQKTRGLHSYTSRVHVADICQAIFASIERPSSGKIYNVVDDDPAARAEVFSYAVSLLEKKWPGDNWEAMEYGTPTGNTGKAVNSNRTLSEKKVSNRRLKDELKVKLLYPTYRMGLQSIIDSMER